MKLLVLAAGYATRLRPLTDHQAKPLLPVRGRPMLDHVLDRFYGAADVNEVFIVTNSRFAPDFADWAQRATADARYPAWQLRVFDDGTKSNEDRLGAIGDILFVLSESQSDDDLIVVAGDNLFTAPQRDFVEAAQRHGVLVGVYDVGDLAAVQSYSNIGISEDKRITFFEEKPAAPKSTLAAIALYHYPRWAIPLIKQYIAEGNSPDQPGRLIQWLYSRVPCYAYPIAGRWLDIGTRESYEEAQNLF